MKTIKNNKTKNQFNVNQLLHRVVYNPAIASTTPNLEVRMSLTDQVAKKKNTVANALKDLGVKMSKAEINNLEWLIYAEWSKAVIRIQTKVEMEVAKQLFGGDNQIVLDDLIAAARTTGWKIRKSTKYEHFTLLEPNGKMTINVSLSSQYIAISVLDGNVENSSVDFKKYGHNKTKIMTKYMFWIKDFIKEYGAKKKRK